MNREPLSSTPSPAPTHGAASSGTTATTTTATTTTTTTTTTTATTTTAATDGTTGPAASAPVSIEDLGWPPRRSIELRRRPAKRSFANALAVGLTLVLPATALPVGWFFFDGTLSIPVALTILGCAILGYLAWLARLFILPAAVPVVVDGGFIELPFGREVRRFCIPELLIARELRPSWPFKRAGLAVIVMLPPGRKALGDVGGVVIPGRCFADVDGPQQVLAAIRDAVDMHPWGPPFRERLDANERSQLAFSKRRPLVTWGVAAVCCLIFATQWWQGALVSLPTLLKFGANSTAAVADGAVWRLVTANLLHGSLLHLGMNMAGLVTTGALLERWLGRSSLAIILVVSGVVGQATSAVRGDIGALGDAAMTGHVSVGISGAIFGLLGVLLTSSILFRGGRPGGVRIPTSAWLLLFVANGALSAIPMVDVSAHVGGFVAGAIVALPLIRRPERQEAALAPRWRTRLAFLAGAVVLAAVGMTLFRGLGG